MIKLIKDNIQFDFVSKFPIFCIISGILVALSIVGILTNLNYGVDFRGGAEIQAKFTQNIELKDLRQTFLKSGFPGVSVITLGEESHHEYLIKVAGEEKDLNPLTEKIQELLKNNYKDTGLEIRKIDIVGPKAGANLRISGFQSLLWALLAIMVYVGLRFDFKYAPGAIVALLHDVSMTLGLYCLLGTEFTLQTVAALLAVIGYSVNDTVIIYDRVREHENKDPSLPLATHINNATNETLSRTIMTSGTTLFVSISMFLFGGDAIKDFFMAVSFGIIVGTYSTIFIAAPVTLFLEKFNKGGTQKAKAQTAT